MRVLLAFDKFKDSLTAPAACAVAADALRAAHPEWTIDSCPLADGGEGFAPILTAAAGGELVAAEVTGPRGRPVRAEFGLVQFDRIPAPARALLGISPGHGGDGAPPSEEGAALTGAGIVDSAARVAVVEMAAASGLALLATEERDPWQATTLGTGELIRLAMERGAAAILLGIGGSATNDLGLGALAALGLEGVAADGRPVIPPVPARWRAIGQLRGRLPAGLPPIRIACDVTNPLLGPNGAAAIYGPQKGLRRGDLARLDHECARLALMLCAHCAQPDALMDAPGAGAAGGIGFGLVAAARARLLPGFELVSAWLDLEARLAAADLVITGEGRFDDSSLQGKGPGAVAARGLALGKPVHVFAGRATATQPPPGLQVHSITPDGVPLEQALREAPGFLAAAVRRAF